MRTISGDARARAYFGSDPRPEPVLLGPARPGTAWCGRAEGDQAMSDPTFRAIPILRIFDLAKAKEFYLDFLGDRREERIERALDHLSELAESIRVLGSYPRSL